MVAVNVTDTCSRVHFPAMGRFRRFNWSLFCSSSLNKFTKSALLQEQDSLSFHCHQEEMCLVRNLPVKNSRPQGSGLCEPSKRNN